MIVKLEGKQHLKGVSRRTGSPYDFITIHFLQKSANVDGLAAMTKNISPSIVDYDRLIVGQHYDFQTDLDGNIITVVPAKS